MSGEIAKYTICIFFPINGYQNISLKCCKIPQINELKNWEAKNGPRRCDGLNEFEYLMKISNSIMRQRDSNQFVCISHPNV